MYTKTFVHIGNACHMCINEIANIYGKAKRKRSEITKCEFFSKIDWHQRNVALYYTGVSEVPSIAICLSCAYVSHLLSSLGIPAVYLIRASQT